MSEQEAQGTILCIAGAAQGRRFLTAAAELGCSVLLLTQDTLEHSGWPREALTDLVTMPEGLRPEHICARVSYLSRHHRIDRIVALAAQDLETAALLREHMRLPGMGQSTTRLFSDRLAMRMRARRGGVATPEFSSVLNYDDLRVFMEDVPAPWLLTPRSLAAAETPKLIDRPQRLWRMLDELGDAQSNYMVERALNGTLYFVESIHWARETLLSRVLRCSPEYGSVPAEVLATQVIPSDGLEGRYVLDSHEQVMESLGMAAGISHAEFLRSEEDGRYLFLEAVAGAGPALSAEVVAAATGIDPWVEWAGMEAAALFGEEYQLPRILEQWDAGSIVSNSGVRLREIEEAAVFFRAENGAGVVLRAKTPELVKEILLEAQGHAPERR